jgi:hypothetical protein
LYKKVLDIILPFIQGQEVYPPFRDRWQGISRGSLERFAYSIQVRLNRGSVPVKDIVYRR